MDFPERLTVMTRSKTRKKIGQKGEERREEKTREDEEERYIVADQSSSRNQVCGAYVL